MGTFTVGGNADAGGDMAAGDIIKESSVKTKEEKVPKIVPQKKKSGLLSKEEVIVSSSIVKGITFIINWVLKWFKGGV